MNENQQNSLYFVCISNSHGNRAGFVQFCCQNFNSWQSFDFIIRILFGYKYKYLDAFLRVCFDKQGQWNNQSIVYVHERKLGKWFESS